MASRGEWLRLALGTLAFFVLTIFALGFYGWGVVPMWGLLPLSLAALLWAAGPTRWWERTLMGLLVLLGVTFVVPSSFVPFESTVGAYAVAVATAFASLALVAPSGVLRQSVRAVLWGVAGTGALGMLARGRFFWAELSWSTVQETTMRVSFMVERRPELATYAPGIVRFLAQALPAFLLLLTLAALLLAWQWHVRIVQRPLGPPLGPFSEFRFGDQWVWGLSLAFVVWAVPKLAALKWIAVNIGIVLGVFYVVRGAAVVVAIATAVGLPGWLLTIGAVVAGLLFVPLFVFVPGLWTLGVFDTWLAFRQRRFTRSPAP